MSTTLSQCAKILRHLKEFGSITLFESIYECDCTRLSARIHDLRCRGIPIETEMIDTVNKHGKPIIYAKYRLGRDKRVTGN